MDSLSQIVLGSAVAEICVGSKIGNKAILWGAVAGTIPDLDVLTNLWMDEFQAMTVHRAFSHSLIFTVLGSFVFAWIWTKLTPPWQGLMNSISRRKDRTPQVNYRGWFMMFFWCFATHIALDCFTTWGTHVLWPLNMPVSTNSIFVADPLYTVPFLLLLITAMFFNRKSKTRRRITWTGIGLSTFYLFFAIGVKTAANSHFEDSFEEQGLEILEYESRPTPLNCWLWNVNAESETGYYLGMYSVFDEDDDIDYFFIKKNHELLEPYRGDKNVEKMIRLTQGWYTVNQTDSCLLVNDLRFGMSINKAKTDARFVFQYQVRENAKGTMDIVASRGIERPNGEQVGPLIDALWRRIKGEKEAAFMVD